MLLLNKYIVKNILLSIMAVMLILTGIEVFIEFTHEFSDIGTGFYGWLQACLFVPMMLPQDLYQLFPMAGLLGSLIGLGVLATHNELTVMRASGISVMRIGGVMLSVAIVVTTLMVILGEVVAPISQHAAFSYKNHAMEAGQALMTRSGVWMRNNDNFIHIGEVSSNGKELTSIVRYQFNDKGQLKLTGFAQKGFYKQGKWFFHDVKQTQFHSKKLTSANFPEQDWGVNFNPKLLGIAKIDTEQKSLPELNDYIKYREQSGLDVSHYKLVFWQRIFQPVSILVMLLLAIPFIFGSLRRVTMGFRILMGVLVGFGFYTFNQIIGPIGLMYQLPPLVVAFLPSLLFAALASFLLVRTR